MAKQDMAPAGDDIDIHATGQPDTPVEVLTALLQTALKQTSLQDTHCIVQQALDIAAGRENFAAWGVNCLLPFHSTLDNELALMNAHPQHKALIRPVACSASSLHMQGHMHKVLLHQAGSRITYQVCLFYMLSVYTV